MPFPERPGPRAFDEPERTHQSDRWESHPHAGAPLVHLMLDPDPDGAWPRVAKAPDTSLAAVGEQEHRLRMPAGTNHRAAAEAACCARADTMTHQRHHGQM